MALCAANAAGNEVTGTGSGGVEQWVAADTADLLFVDYHSGQLCGVIPGGKSRDRQMHRHIYSKGGRRTTYYFYSFFHD